MACSNTFVSSCYSWAFAFCVFNQLITQSDCFNWIYQPKEQTSCENSIRWHYKIATKESFVNSNITFASGKLIASRQKGETTYSLQSGYTSNEYIVKGKEDITVVVVKRLESKYTGKYCCNVTYTNQSSPLYMYAKSCTDLSTTLCPKDPTTKKVNNNYALFFGGLVTGLVILVAMSVVIFVKQSRFHQEDLPAMSLKPFNIADPPGAHDGPASSASVGDQKSASSQPNKTAEDIPVSTTSVSSLGSGRDPDLSKTQNATVSSVSVDHRGSTDSPNAHDGPASAESDQHRGSIDPPNAHDGPASAESDQHRGSTDPPNAHDGPASAESDQHRGSIDPPNAHDGPASAERDQHRASIDPPNAHDGPASAERDQHRGSIDPPNAHDGPASAERDQHLGSIDPPNAHDGPASVESN